MAETAGKAFVLDRFIASGSTTYYSSLGPDVGPVEILYRDLAEIARNLWISTLRVRLKDPLRSCFGDAVVQLSLWEGNFRPGKLDLVLQYTGYLRASVLEILRKIAKALTYICQMACDNDPDQATEKASRELEDIASRASNFLSDLNGSLSSDEDSVSDDTNRSEVEVDCYARLQSLITCLMDSSIAIERQSLNIRGPGPLDEQQPLPHSDTTLDRKAQPFAVLIRDRFRDAKQELVDRLAYANLERLTRLRAAVADEAQSHGANDPQVDTHTVPGPSSDFHDSGLGTSITMSDARSHTSFLSAATDDAEGRARVPPIPPEGKLGCPFRCDYCGRIVSIRNRVQWKMHVFSDLQSYSCTHPECEQGLKSFPTRSLWAKHELDEHFSQKSWRCSSCGGPTMSQDEYVNHLAQAHKNITPGVVETAMMSNFKDYPCPLCLSTGWQSGEAYATHLGKHLEEISLAVLPKIDGSDSNSLLSQPDLKEEKNGLENAASDFIDTNDDPTLSLATLDSTEIEAWPLPGPYPEDLSGSTGPRKMVKQSNLAPQTTTRRQFSRLGRSLSSRFARLTERVKRPLNPTTEPVKEYKSIEEPALLSYRPMTNRFPSGPGFDIRINLPGEDELEATPMTAVIDTANYSDDLLSARGWAKINAKHRNKLEPGDDFFVRIGSEVLNVLGIAKGLNWRLNNSYIQYSSDFYVLEISQWDVVIGFKTIQRYSLLTGPDNLAMHLEGRARPKEDDVG